MSRLITVALMLNLCCVAESVAQNSRPSDRSVSRLGPQAGDVDHYQPVTVIGSAIRPITDPPIVAADQAGLSENELVIGVTVRGKARAYPINQLTGPRREIINDQLADTAIAATW